MQNITSIHKHPAVWLLFLLYTLWAGPALSQGVLVKETYPGPVGGLSYSVYGEFEGAEVNGIFYFPAQNEANGNEIWRTDGTPEGTYLFKDLNTNSVYSPFTNSSIPQRFAAENNVLYFTNYFEPNILYICPNGEVTKLKGEPWQRSTLYAGHEFRRENGKLYLHTRNDWRTSNRLLDGERDDVLYEVNETEYTLTEYAKIGRPQFLNGRFYAFSGDGLGAYPGGSNTLYIDYPRPSYPNTYYSGGPNQKAQRYLAKAGTNLFWIIQDYSERYRLNDLDLPTIKWLVSDGSNANPKIVKRFADPYRQAFVLGEINNKMIVAAQTSTSPATNPTSSWEYWVTDGTPAGTLLMKTMGPFTSSTRPDNVVTIRGSTKRAFYYFLPFLRISL